LMAAKLVAQHPRGALKLARTYAALTRKPPQGAKAVR
jgi:hypothetical protein